MGRQHGGTLCGASPKEMNDELLSPDCPVAESSTSTGLASVSPQARRTPQLRWLRLQNDHLSGPQFLEPFGVGA
jgi:hypothetical protein